jgi:hypothetical protein
MNSISVHLHSCKPSTRLGNFFSHMDPQLEKKGKKEKGKGEKGKGKRREKRVEKE